MASFLQDTIDFFLLKRSSHMGLHQYAAHKGIRNGQSTSGDFLWAKTDETRSQIANGTVQTEEELIRTVASDVLRILPKELTIVDLGPGTVSAFERKARPFIESLSSPCYIPVDESISFLKGIAQAGRQIKHTDIRPVIDDFFENSITYSDNDSLILCFCGTIGNMLSPISPFIPRVQLTNTLRTFAKAIDRGWMLLSVDGCQDGRRIKDDYLSHPLFHLNIFDRMKVELPISDSFDPCAFEYEPLWIASSGQLAHMAVAKNDMSFTLAGIPIHLAAGQKLHIKNSYKIQPSVFMPCAEQAGLSIVQSWGEDSATKIYLLHKEPEPLALNNAEMASTSSRSGIMRRR